MTAIGEADALRLGLEEVDRAYLGDDLVWEPSVSVFAPSDLAGLAVWLDASQLGLAGGAAVSPWPNLANAGLPGAIIGTPAPAVRAAALNALPVVRFTVSEGRLRISGTGITTSWTLVYVGRMVSNPNRHVGAIYPAGGNWLIGYHGGLQDLMYDNGWTSPHVPTAWSTAWKLYSGDGAPGLSRFFADGALLGSAASAAGPGGTLAVSGYGATTPEETSDCELAELCHYNRKLPDLERQQVEAYLRAKWGL